MIPTQLMPPAAGEVWLERSAGDSNGPATIEIAEFPFTIGRNEHCGVCIDSTRVSREHAQIERVDGELRVRDLGSRNGTFVNGASVKESPLHDGDVLTIADVEFGFRRRAPVVLAAETQPMQSPARGPTAAREWIEGVRRLQERLVQRALAPGFAPIVRFEDQQVEGYTVVSPDRSAAALSPIELSLLETDCRLTARIRQLERHLAVAQAEKLPGGRQLFLRLAAAEIGAAELGDTLRQLRSLAADRRQIVVELPDAAISDSPQVRDFIGMVRALEFRIAFGGFTGGRGHAAGRRAIAPDYIKLAASLVRDCDRQAHRRRQIEEARLAAEDLGCEVIAAGVSRAEEATACRDAGCRFAEGTWFGAVLIAGCH